MKRMHGIFQILLSFNSETNKGDSFINGEMFTQEVIAKDKKKPNQSLQLEAREKKKKIYERSTCKLD